MARSTYAALTEGEVALAAAGTAKSVLGVIANDTTFAMELLGFRVDFDGVSSSDKPIRVEICECTWATNAPGTNSTAVTVVRQSGQLANTGWSAAKNWTAEPTVLTPIEQFALDVNKGLVFYDWPLGETPDSALNDGYVIRLLIESGDTASGAVRASMRFARC